MGSGARLEHACIKHHLNTLLILFYHIYIFICTRQCVYYTSNRKPWFLSIVGLWADYWGNSWHVSPRRYKKLAHGCIFWDFFREPAQGRIFEWALLQELPVGLHLFSSQKELIKYVYVTLYPVRTLLIHVNHSSRKSYLGTNLSPRSEGIKIYFSTHKTIPKRSHTIFVQYLQI